MTEMTQIEQDISAIANNMFGKWLREVRIKSGYKNLKTVSKKTGIALEILDAAEAGKHQLTLTEADKLGRIYKGTNFQQICSRYELCLIQASGIGTQLAWHI